MAGKRPTNKVVKPPCSMKERGDISPRADAAAEGEISPCRAGLGVLDWLELCRRSSQERREGRLPLHRPSPGRPGCERSFLFCFAFFEFPFQLRGGFICQGGRKSSELALIQSKNTHSAWSWQGNGTVLRLSCSPITKRLAPFRGRVAHHATHHAVARLGLFWSKKWAKTCRRAARWPRSWRK